MESEHVDQAAPAAASPTSEYVRRFAGQMEGKLALNRHKGDRPGWMEMGPFALVLRLREEVEELARAVVMGEPPEVIAGEAADVGNFAMFIADRCGGLPAEPATAEGDDGR